MKMLTCITEDRGMTTFGMPEYDREWDALWSRDDRFVPMSTKLKDGRCLHALFDADEVPHGGPGISVGARAARDLAIFKLYELRDWINSEVVSLKECKP